MGSFRHVYNIGQKKVEVEFELDEDGLIIDADYYSDDLTEDEIDFLEFKIGRTLDDEE